MPADLNAMVESARAAVESDQVAAAGVFYRSILRETSPPKTATERVAHGEACWFNGRLALARGKLGEAADWYKEALDADPRATDYRIEFVIRCLIPMGALKDARIEAERATRIDPHHPMAWRTLASVEHSVSNAEGAIAAYDRQLELLDAGTPEYANALVDRISIAIDTADYVTVRRLCDRVMGTERQADALHCLAMAAYREAEHEKAIELFDAAIAGGCYDPALARWNKSLALHAIGQWEEGWSDHEQRGKQRTDRAMALMMNRFVMPIWDGEPGPARLHVHQEMGSGDVIAMARYLPILVRHGYDVRLEVNEQMVDLMRASLDGVTVMAKAPDYPSALGIPPFDYHVPMLSLPYLFKTTVNTVPTWVPYLKAPTNFLRFQNPGLKVGLCWSSGIRDGGVWLREYGMRKSMSFDDLQPLIMATDHQIQFFSLQIGPERRQVAWPVHDIVLPKKPTWGETADLIAQLDLVITVDTSVAHLAGAMGKPVWVMAQRDCSSWHFMCWRPDAVWNDRSPWYPSARVFRQHRFNEPHKWDEVVEDVTKALIEWADAQRANLDAAE
jgi:Glycosyltransferase family 9 (heptosyltransferase)